MNGEFTGVAKRVRLVSLVLLVQKQKGPSPLEIAPFYLNERCNALVQWLRCPVEAESLKGI